MCSSVQKKTPGLTPLLGLHLFDLSGICRAATHHNDAAWSCGRIAEMSREQEAYCFCGVIKALSLRLNQFLDKASDLPALWPFSQMGRPYGIPEYKLHSLHVFDQQKSEGLVCL
ncbi:hypothetical protein DFP73DRAFT_547904 [Morchella snyderi]|nr:hypothetical protein DFP73DRAFT_547904 [Morchella snyderi]